MAKDVWLPAETLDLIRDYPRCYQRPIDHPQSAAGIRSLNVHCVRSWTCTSVCVRCVTIRAPQARLSTLN